jgi:cytochrome P450
MTRQVAQHPDHFTFPSPALQECPFPFYEALREEAPVYKLPGRHEFLVSRWEDVTFVAERPDIFSSVISDGKWANPGTSGEDGPQEETYSYFADGKDVSAAEGGADEFGYSPTSMALCDPPENKLKRAVGARLIGRERLREYDPMIRRYTNELIDAFIDRGEAEFVEDFAYWLPIKVIVDVLGLPQEDMVLLKRVGNLAGQGSRFMTEQELVEETALQTELVDYLREQILDRAENPRDDGLGQLVSGQIERDGKLNLPYLLSEAAVLVFAGNTTTTHMLSSAMLLLLKNPDQLERVVADRSLIRPLLEEALRLESPVQWTQRRVMKDAEIGGVPVKAGTTLLCLWASGNRDPRRWGDDADEFRVDRPSIAKHHLAFGRGTHLCLGAPLARLEGEIAFDILFDRIENVRLAPGKENPRHIQVHHMRAPSAVRLQFDKRATT